MVIKMNVPKLRFYEFNDEWKKEKLNKHASFLQGLTYNPKDISEEGVIVLRSSNIQNSSISYNDIIKVNINIPEKLKIHENDILMCVRNGSKKLVGKTALLGKSEENCTWGAFMNIIRPVENNKFIYYYLNSPYFYKHIWKDLGTATVNQITKQTLDSFKLNIPTVTEQKKIGNMLSLLDRKIELQSKKIEALKLYKKGLLYQEYNKLYNFGNLLELGKLAKIYQPHTISSNLCNNGDFFVFGANGIIGKYSKYNHENVQITISCRGEYAGTVNLTPKKCWINGNSMVINIDNSMIIEKDYLRYILESQNLKYLISGSGQPQIIRSDVMKHKIPIIKYEKQTDFYTKFVLLDKKLNFEYKYLNKLQQLKKGLMQNMFV